VTIVAECPDQRNCNLLSSRLVEWCRQQQLSAIDYPNVVANVHRGGDDDGRRGLGTKQCMLALQEHHVRLLPSVLATGQSVPDPLQQPYEAKLWGQPPNDNDSSNEKLHRTCNIQIVARQVSPLFDPSRSQHGNSNLAFGTD
jgi:hypothetical protein